MLIVKSNNTNLVYRKKVDKNEVILIINIDNFIIKKIELLIL